jgi:hypothetical protein
VDQLTKGGAEPNSLVGAAILRVSAIRTLGTPERWFCVYDTEDGTKEHHADVLATIPQAESRSKRDRVEKDRRAELSKLLGSYVVKASTVPDLVGLLRQAVWGKTSGDMIP